MATIGLQTPYYAVITEDPVTGYETYGTPKRLAKAISADLSIELLEAILYADNGASEAVKQFKSGTISLGVDNLLSGVKQELLGAKIDKNGAVTWTAESQAPYVAIGFAALRSDGKSEYIWLYRVRFGIPNRTFQTAGDSITFNTPTIEGTVMRRNKPDSGNDHPFMTGAVDGEAGVQSSLISGWFSAVYDPTYSDTAVSLSALSIGSVTLSPTFDANVTEYTASTTSATNTVSATKEDSSATLVITVNGNSLTNASSATWETGTNNVVITVTKGTSSKVYTVVVTKS